MTEIKKIFNKNTILWTAVYFGALAIILRACFGFDIFSAHHWSMLFSIRLHGFAGFVFMCIILTSVPIYIATIKTIIKTGKPIFDFKKEVKKEPATRNQEPIVEEIAPPELPENLPTEMIGAYMRTRRNGMMPFVKNESAIPTYTPSSDALRLTPHELTNDGFIPLPDNFDFDTPNPAAPVFKEINFDDDVPSSNALRLTHYELTDDAVIYTHSDPDFWIADETEWFANGRQIPSPITELLKIAKEKNLQPVIELKEKNILDLENKIEEWTGLGIKVVS
jgi:hypothetical protein